MNISFAPVSLNSLAEYERLRRLSRIKASDYSFANLWGWAEHYGLELGFGNNLCWIRQTYPYKCYWAPLGDWEKVDWQAETELESGQFFSRIPQELIAFWQEQLPEKFVVEEARGQWDYLYSAEGLATLSGNKFHKKKNLLNQFLKKYPDHVYTPLGLDCVEWALAMQEEWCYWNECPESAALMAENNAVFRVLSHWDQLPGLVGGVIWLEGKVVAYTVGEALTEDTLVVHFEKGTTSYKGIYQAINNLFVNDAGVKFTYINREQDLDDEGLRKAKESYNPVAYIEKNAVRFVK